MLKAGADRAATGENAVVVGCRRADVILGPIGIVMADALLGEITPAMAQAAKAFGANGFFFEVHPDPDHAKSDGPNMLQLDELENLIKTLL